MPIPTPRNPGPRPAGASEPSRLLAELIDTCAWVDTHEHLIEERNRLRDDSYAFTDGIGIEACVPGDWTSLVAGSYLLEDLVSAGLSSNLAARFVSNDLAPLEKWAIVEPYMEFTRFTGYRRVMDSTTERLFGARLSRDTCEEIDRQGRELRKTGYYRYVLRDVANVQGCQVHSVEEDPFCLTETPDLLDQDIALAALVRGYHERAERLSGLDVGTLDDYLEVVDWVFAEYGPRAVAVKCVWAYQRSLAVGQVDGRPRRSFERMRRGIDDAADRTRVQDFLFRRCLDLATRAGLPVKLHLGSLANNGVRRGDPRLRNVYKAVVDVTRLVQEYPRTPFVLMHMAWPQQEQLLALAKHQANVTVEMSWTWAVAPRSTRDFVQRFLTTAPVTKLLCFGGDYLTVETVVGHAELARRGLQAALEGLVYDGWLTLEEAVDVVPLLMRDNAARVFRTRATASQGDVSPILACG